MLLGWILKRLFKWPAWTVPAICFNNTTALPLLLIQSLDAAGILKDLTMGEGDSSSAAVRRAKSYFLVCSIVGNSLTFALGPRLLDDEESPDTKGKEDNQEDEYSVQNGHMETDAERANPTNNHGRTAEEEQEFENETTTLLPDSLARRGEETSKKLNAHLESGWSKLPHSLQTILSEMYSFLNAPVIGAVVGAILGLVPPFHRAFFSEPEKGGFFKVWRGCSTHLIGS